MKLAIHSKKIWSKLSKGNFPSSTSKPHTRAACIHVATCTHASTRTCVAARTRAFACTCAARTRTVTCSWAFACTGNNSTSCCCLSRSRNIPSDHCPYPSLSLCPSLVRTLAASSICTRNNCLNVAGVFSKYPSVSSYNPLLERQQPRLKLNQGLGSS